ncbi:MAG: ATP-grasp domain-containing protein, partial [Bacteroidota bacterium]
MVKVGIIGGGQLGMMTIEASSPEVPAHFTVLESSPDCPAKPLANQFIAGSLTSDASIRELATSADVLTWEIEHINVDTLLQLQAQGKTIVPNPTVLTTIQNKGIQKQHYTLNNIPTAPYTIVNSTEITPSLLEQFPGEEIVVKTCTGGYDGKGVAILSKSQLLQNPPFQGSVLLEAKISPALEISIIVAVGQPNQNQQKETAVYPAIEMYFHPVSNLVEFLFSPARIHPSIEEKAKQVALNAVESFNSPGLFAVELFLVPNT